VRHLVQQALSLFGKVVFGLPTHGLPPNHLSLGEAAKETYERVRQDKSVMGKPIRQKCWASVRFRPQRAGNSFAFNRSFLLENTVLEIS
jgi:hypothetical protein